MGINEKNIVIILQYILSLSYLIYASVALFASSCYFLYVAIVVDVVSILTNRLENIINCALHSLINIYIVIEKNQKIFCKLSQLNNMIYFTIITVRIYDFLFTVQKLALGSN